MRRLRSEPTLRVEALSRDLGLPVRTLRRQVSAAVGLSPKQLQRILRFHRMRARFAAPSGIASAAVAALELGFADQAHMIRECRTIAGCTPAELRLQQRDGRFFQDRPPTG